MQYKEIGSKKALDKALQSEHKFQIGTDAMEICEFKLI